ncbi:hypothetical protein Tsubulata_036885 [Turnera subulata]|uniref:Chromo domain-containing protein n=1 Tax=Turnera subulata TaxID=218843 RepID=A0A9Q0F1X6_9ROSI|nr:hypothetical protein Tsubulata_036885 [Turnera subulata]
MILQPAEVLDTRVLQENDARVEEWLIRWEGLPSSAATWENKADLCRKYPSMNLEDKVQSGDGELSLNHTHTTSSTAFLLPSLPSSTTLSNSPASFLSTFSTATSSSSSSSISSNKSMSPPRTRHRSRRGQNKTVRLLASFAPSSSSWSPSSSSPSPSCTSSSASSSPSP